MQQQLYNGVEGTALIGTEEEDDEADDDDNYEDEEFENIRQIEAKQKQKSGYGSSS